MAEIKSGSAEVKSIEISAQETMPFKEIGDQKIKPTTKMSVGQAENVLRALFDKLAGNRLSDGKIDSTNEISEGKQKLQDYMNDIKSSSEFPDTIETDKTADELKKRSPEECAEKRLEFQSLRDKLIREWEDKTGQEWPRYDKDVTNENGKVIRKAGDRYDAHHIIPLEVGGENTADNITPISAEKHYDKQGIHSPGSPYDTLIKYCKEKGDSE